MIWKRLRLTLDMIKFEHSVFALPFALTGALLAFREGGFSDAEVWRKLLWIVVAMVAARSAAMAFNRAGGCRYRRAAIRARGCATCPPDCSSRGFAWGFRRRVVGWSSCWRRGQLNPLCFRLAPVALAIVFFYSFTKRFTSFSHLVLGFAWGSRRPRPGSRCAARSIRASSGSPPRSPSGPPASTSSTPARITNSTASKELFSMPRCLGIARRAVGGARAARR